MKKLFLCMVVALMAMGASAQVTWNLKAGLGALFEYNDKVGAYFTENAAVQANIPLMGKTKPLTFSPSLEIEYMDTEYDSYANFNLPLHLGYKFYIADAAILFPKIGPMVGVAIGEDADLMVGPSAELAFEIKHLVISLNGYYNAIQNKHFGVAGGLFANIGYKF